VVVRTFSFGPNHPDFDRSTAEFSVKELISLATDSFCSKPDGSAVMRNGSKEMRLPPAAAKVKPLAKHLHHAV
jgi:hypothetical protein